MRFLQRILGASVLVLSAALTVLLVFHTLTLSRVLRQTQARRLRPQPLSTTTLPETPVGSVGDFLSHFTFLPSPGGARSIIGVMIENHEDARPHQRGLEDAILIEEFPVEGFISRFHALFDLHDLPAEIGPVRSLRPYFIDAAYPWARMLLHAGGSPEAFDRLAAFPDVVAINGLRDSRHFLRDDTLPAPHNLFLPWRAVEELARELRKDRSFPHTSWPPYSTGRLRSASGALQITLDFRNPTHDVLYTYDFFSQAYIRRNGGIVSRAQPSNVLILEIPVENIGEFGRLTLDIEGKGRALLFRNGTVERGHWRRSDPKEGFVFEDEKGDPLVFARGQTWMTALPSLERVEWE